MATSNSNEPKAPEKSAPAAKENTQAKETTSKDNTVPVTKDEVQAAHEQRIKGAFDGVDARLDNRVGGQRPKVEEWPAKPQQVDGPSILNQAEFTREVLANREKEAEGRKGMFSAGPHGTSDDTLRESGPVGVTDQVLYGTEGLTEAEMKETSKGSKEN